MLAESHALHRPAALQLTTATTSSTAMLQWPMMHWGRVGPTTSSAWSGTFFSTFCASLTRGC